MSGEGYGAAGAQQGAPYVVGGGAEDGGETVPAHKYEKLKKKFLETVEVRPFFLPLPFYALLRTIHTSPRTPLLLVLLAESRRRLSRPFPCPKAHPPPSRRQILPPRPRRPARVRRGSHIPRRLHHSRPDPSCRTRTRLSPPSPSRRSLPCRPRTKTYSRRSCTQSRDLPAAPKIASPPYCHCRAKAARRP